MPRSQVASRGCADPCHSPHPGDRQAPGEGPGVPEGGARVRRHAVRDHGSIHLRHGQAGPRAAHRLPVRMALWCPSDYPLSEYDLLLTPLCDEPQIARVPPGGARRPRAGGAGHQLQRQA